MGTKKNYFSIGQATNTLGKWKLTLLGFLSFIFILRQCVMCNFDALYIQNRCQILLVFAVRLLIRKTISIYWKPIKMCWPLIFRETDNTHERLLEGANTDKETDESWDIFVIWKINSGLVWAAGPVLWKKSLRPIMSIFWGLFYMFWLVKNI